MNTKTPTLPTDADVLRAFAADDARDRERMAKHSVLPWTAQWRGGGAGFAVMGRNETVASYVGEANAALIVRAVNAHEELVAACKAALNLAWEVGSETDDGVRTLLEDSRGDLYRQLSAALSRATGTTAGSEQS